MAVEKQVEILELDLCYCYDFSFHLHVYECIITNDVTLINQAVYVSADAILKF